MTVQDNTNIEVKVKFTYVYS
ncbi:hypothetical protein Q0N25_14435, partial [Staphylococcus aureus]|nr:hypothetical protein [Staphylococcus aureus]